jgi:hypothetical protein
MNTTLQTTPSTWNDVSIHGAVGRPPFEAPYQLHYPIILFLLINHCLISAWILNKSAYRKQ